MSINKTESSVIQILVLSLDGLFDDNDSVTVLNACRHGAPNGFIHTTSGVAYRPNPSEQGKLMVKLNGSLASNCKSHFESPLHAFKKI